LLVVMINCFHFVWYPQSNEILLNLGMKMPSFSISCTRLETNYSTCCTRKSSENICSNEILLNLGMKMLSFSISCTRFETN
jgi:hypothetical protein